MKTSNFIKKTLSLILCLCLTATFASCGKTEEDDDDGKVVTATDDSVVDMNGYEFTIASSFLLDKPVASEITGAEQIFE